MASILLQQVCNAVNALLDRKEQIRVLEGGCGSASQISFNGEVRAIGIDIASDELEKNNCVLDGVGAPAAIQRC